MQFPAKKPSNYHEKEGYGNGNFKFTSLKKRKYLYKQTLCQKP